MDLFLRDETIVAPLLRRPCPATAQRMPVRQRMAHTQPRAAITLSLARGAPVHIPHDRARDHHGGGRATAGTCPAPGRHALGPAPLVATEPAAGDPGQCSPMLLDLARPAPQRHGDSRCRDLAMALACLV